MNVLLDINVILDVLLQRAPWVTEASGVWDAHHQGRLTAHVAAFSVPTIFYVVRFGPSPVRAVTPAELLAELASNDVTAEEPE